MKKLLLPLMLVCSFYYASAQYFYIKYNSPGQNPGGINNDLEYPLSDITGWTSILVGPKSTPDWSTNQNIPFAFSFNGNPVTSYKVSSSGVLTFTTGATTAPPEANATLPSASIPDNSICIWGLKANTGDNIATKTFGTQPNRQHWIFFSSFSEAGIKDGWTYWSIVLEESSNNIYLVDQRTNCISGQNLCSDKTTLTLGVQVDNTTAYQVTGSPNVQAEAGNDPSSIDNKYYEFIAGNQPQYDLEGKSVDIKKFLVLNTAPFVIKANFFNRGTTAVTSADLNYSINNGPAVTANVTGLNGASLGTFAITHPTGWTPANTGTYTIKVWASNINGNADENLVNDETSITVEVVDQFVPRLPLHETFSASSCPPCRPGNIQLQNILDQRPQKYTVIKYQQNFPGLGDPYCTVEAVNRRNYYAINSIPRLELDGGWNQNPSDYNTSIFDAAEEIPAFLSITATHKVNYHHITVDVKLDPLTNFNSTNLKLHVAVMESKTVKNVSTNGETEFHHVMKKMLPNENGTNTGVLTKGSAKTYTLKYNFNGEYRLPPAAINNMGTYIGIVHATENSVENFNNMEVVVFVQDNATKEVLQSAWSTGGVENVGVQPAEFARNMRVYPNPVNNEAVVEMELTESKELSLAIYNVLGERVMLLEEGQVEKGSHSFTINTSHLVAGTYFVKIQSNDQSMSQKMVVVR